MMILWKFKVFIKSGNKRNMEAGGKNSKQKLETLEVIPIEKNTIYRGID